MEPELCYQAKAVVTQLGRNDSVPCTHYLCSFCTPHYTQTTFPKGLEFNYYHSQSPVTLEMKKESPERVKN